MLGWKLPCENLRWMACWLFRCCWLSWRGRDSSLLSRFWRRMWSWWTMMWSVPWWRKECWPLPGRILSSHTSIPHSSLKYVQADRATAALNKPPQMTSPEVVVSRSLPCPCPSLHRSTSSSSWSTWMEVTWCSTSKTKAGLTPTEPRKTSCWVARSRTFVTVMFLTVCSR